MIQVVNRALDILEYLSIDKDTPKQLGQMAKDLNMNTTTCANIVKTLLTRGYLEKSNHPKGYLLGRRLNTSNTKMTGGYQSMWQVANEEMTKITGQLNESCLIAILNGEYRKVIYKKKCGQLIQATTLDEKKAYDSTSGRLLLAMLSDSELDKYVQKYGLPSANIWNTATTRSQFNVQIDIIRKNGYALGEDSIQVIGIAAPIYKNNKVIASLSIYLPAFRFNNVKKNEMVKEIMASAQRISEAL